MGATSGVLAVFWGVVVALAAVIIAVFVLALPLVLPTWAKRRVFCDWLHVHRGHVERYGGVMVLKCHRCGRIAHPTLTEHGSLISPGD